MMNISQGSPIYVQILHFILKLNLLSRVLSRSNPAKWNKIANMVTVLPWLSSLTYSVSAPCVLRASGCEFVRTQLIPVAAMWHGM